MCNKSVLRYRFTVLDTYQLDTLCEQECVISGSHCEVDENCTLLGYYTVSSDNSLPMFEDNLSVPSSKVKNVFLTLEDGTYKVVQNVSKELPLLTV